MDENKEYYAFISYKREDEKWAKWLQNKLEHYKFPTNLNGRTDLPKSIRPTFRDVTDLNPGLLAEEINNALCNSEWLIVVYSPRSAKSPWVCKEAQAFIDLGRADHIIQFVIEGNPFSNDTASECYPEALLNLTGSKELLAANINEMGRDAAAIKVVARMFNLRFDALWQRFEQEQRRKRWMWIGGSILFALLGLGIGAYFVKQNRTIENQNAQLLTAKVHQIISLARAYLSQNRPEMSIMIMNEINGYLGRLDSVKRYEYQQLKVSLCDSILTSPVLLVDIQDVTEHPLRSLEAILAQNDAFLFRPMIGNDPLDSECVYISNKKTNTSDTIYGNPKIVYKASQNNTYTAFLNFSADKYSDFDQDDFPKDCYISIYSLKTGELENAVSCDMWLTGTYPMSLTNDGKYLIYRKGTRAHESIWFVDFIEQNRTLIQNWYTNSTEVITSAFSPNDRYYFIYYSKKKEISIHLTHPQNKLHTLRYENCEDVYWNDFGNLCVSSEGNIYVWEIIENKLSQIFDIGTYANGVAISSNKKYAAAACNNGYVYIWDISSGEMVFGKEIMSAPEDVAFAKDGKTLWVVSGYNCIMTIIAESGKTNEVYDEPKPVSHPWPTYLCMTKDGKYCVSYCTYFQDHYTFIDMKGKLIDDDNFTEFEFLERYNYDPDCADERKPELTARRFSADGEMCIEGYSNGVIKIALLQDRSRIDSLIGGNSKALKR